MSPPGRPKGEYRSAQREGDHMSPPGRPKGEYRSVQREGGPIRPPQAGAIVVAGAGQAGGHAAVALRQHGYAGRVLLVGAEPHAPYERPPLSKAVLGGQAAPESTELFSAQKLRELDIEFRPGVAVRRLRLDARRVELSGGGSAAYDSLLLCTGGRPVVPLLPGAEGPGVYVLRTRDDALKLRAALGPGRRLLVVGGGWIGLEVAATARQAGCEVTVLEQAGRLCARSVPAGIAASLAALHAAQGVAVRTGVRLARIEHGPAAVLEDGERLAADAILLGVGLRPNDELARAAGIACEAGILVDAYCRTSAPGVYAAGDVAVMRLPRAGGAVRLESWQNAQDQGTAAARAALGAGEPYRPSGAVWSEQFDSMIQIVGFPAAGVREVLRPGAGGRGLLSIALDAEGRMAGGVAVDAGRDFRQLRVWYQDEAPLDEVRLRNAELPLAAARNEKERA